MRHGKRLNHLGRTAPHRKATLSNLASSLLLYKRINTTLAKAKELRRYVEPLITKAKNDTTHSRRIVFSYLQNKESVSALYNEVVDRVGERPGGYTRIIKLGSRLGDNAEMAMIELVDFNDLLLEEAAPKKTRTRRSRRGGGKGKIQETESADTKETEKKKSTEGKQQETKKAEEVKEDKAETEKAKEPEAAASEERKEDQPSDKTGSVKEEKKDEGQSSKEPQGTAGKEEKAKAEETESAGTGKEDKAPDEAKEEKKKEEDKNDGEEEDKK